MNKKIVLVLLLATVLAGGAFAQSMSAGVGGGFAALMESQSHKDFDIPADDQPPTNTGVAFGAFFDASYAMVKLGMFIGGHEEKDGDFSMKMTGTFLSLGVLGKYPIDLGGFTLFPMLGFEYNMFQSMEMSIGPLNVKMKRSEIEDLGDKASELDQLILQLGVGADINLTEQLYLRPTLLWGIDLNSTEREKKFKDDGGSIFRHKLDIGVAVGFKF